jgi:head-tail adaptor
MRGGKLRSRVRIEQPTLTQDGTGAQQLAWTTFLDRVPAEIYEDSSRTILQAGQASPQRRMTVSIRFYPGITPAMRFIYTTPEGTRTFYIDGPALNYPNERRRELKFTCQERA